VVRLTPAALERLRDSLRVRGARPSVVFGPPGTSAEVVDAMQVVSQYGALCEAMFLVMLCDKKVKNVEREVLRGALRILSNDAVRSSQIESMLDSASRNVAENGFESRLHAVIDKLREDPAQAELAYVLATAVAAADGVIVAEEQALLTRLAEGLGIDEERANALLAQFDEDAAKA
jgi:tellurite resistance protein